MKEYCEIGFGGYDECPELWFGISIIDDDGNDLIEDRGGDGMIRMGEFPILYKMEHPDEFISINKSDYDDDDDCSVFHIIC